MLIWCVATSSYFPFTTAFQINFVFVCQYRPNSLLGSCSNLYFPFNNPMCLSHLDKICFLLPYSLTPQLTSQHNSKPVYRLQQQSIRRLAFVPPYSVFCSISFRCGGLSIERNQKPLAPEITLAVTHHDRQKQVEAKRSSRVNPHEIRIFSGCPYYISSPFSFNGWNKLLPDSIIFNFIVILCTTHMMTRSVVAGNLTSISCHSGA